MKPFDRDTGQEAIRISVRIPLTMAGQLARAAHRRQTSRPDMIRQIISEWIEADPFARMDQLRAEARQQRRVEAESEG